jgi:hypothetical protein
MDGNKFVHIKHDNEIKQFSYCIFTMLVNKILLKVSNEVLKISVQILSTKSSS